MAIETDAGAILILEEMGELLGIKRETVQEWRRAGKIHRTICRRYYFSRKYVMSRLDGAESPGNKLED